MAHVYVGFHDQRNSSRVLKPPGGGTSDIFGTDTPKGPKNIIEALPSTNEKNELKVAPKPISETTEQNGNEDNSKNGSTAENIEQEEKHDISKPSPDEEPKIENLNISDEDKEKQNIEKSQTESKPEIKASATTDSINNIIQQQQEKQVNQPEKKTSNRVPPGGYSSGLW